MLRERGQLIGLLPVCRRRGALFSPTNWHTQEFGLLAEPAVVAPELLRQTLANRGGAHRISLSFLDPGRNDLEAWRAAAQAQRFRVLTRPFVRSAHVDICGSWEAYERSLSRNIRSDMRRSLRRLGEAGEVSFEHLDGRERLDSLLTEGFGVESSGWKALRGTAIASSPETELFYREVSAWAAQKGSLRLAFLRLDGRAIAFELAIEEDGIFYALKSGFDPQFRAFSPGKLLIHRTLEHAFSVGLARYEMAGIERYKLAWANAFRDLMLLQAFARSPRGLVDWAGFRYGRPIAKRTLTAVRAGGPDTPGRS